MGLRGRVRIWVGQESFEVGEGEAATYDSTVPNCIEPAEPVKPREAGPQVLQIYLP